MIQHKYHVTLVTTVLHFNHFTVLYCYVSIFTVHHTTSCIAQSNAPEDGQNNCPKHVELIRIISKQLLLHLVGCLPYYLYQWCMVKQISNLPYSLWKGTSCKSKWLLIRINWMKQFFTGLEDGNNILKNVVPYVSVIFIIVCLHHLDVKKVELSVTSVSQLGSSVSNVK
jgi:hypothetical protein